MQKLTLTLAAGLVAVGLSIGITAQVQELPNVPIVASGWQEKF